MTDALGHRLVFGVLLPSQNTVVQPEIEAELGTPVVGVNAATYWRALRENGIDDRLDGHGRLFSDH